MLRAAAVLAISFSFVSSVVQADTIHNVATALDYAGFDARGSRNPLSGGVDLLITRQFNGNLFDFGGAELAVQGPISLQVSTGGRVLPQFDVAFSTAANARSQATPLSYNYSSDIGPQSTSISGSMLIDGNFSINALGFYDLTLRSSARNTITRDGVVTDSGTIDSDVGPITVSGNVFADVLAILTDPLFEQSGRENPFDAISKLLIDASVDGTSALATLPDLDSQASLNANRSFDAFHPAVSHANHGRAVGHAAVPEPTVLIMLLLGLPLIARRAWRMGHA